MRRARTSLSLCVWCLAFAARTLAGQESSYSDDLLAQARTLAHAVPGELPLTVHYLAFGELKAPLSTLVQNAGDELVMGVYTVFQVRYARGWVMIDAGVDREAEPDTSVKIDSARYDRVQQAVEGASLILVTHEHHDHVAGIIRARRPETVVPKSLLTRAQVQTLLDRPNSPLIQLSPATAARYVVLDYDRLYPVAPGIVLIRSPGHTPGSQMVFVQLATGQELLFVGDIVWMMDGLEGPRQKPEGVSRELGEDRVLLQRQMDWLAAVSARQPIVLVNCHDDAWLRTLVRRRILIGDLNLSR